LSDYLTPIAYSTTAAGAPFVAYYEGSTVNRTLNGTAINPTVIPIYAS